MKTKTLIQRRAGKVNEAWLKQHVTALFSKIFSRIQAKQSEGEKLTDMEILVLGWIQQEWFNLELPEGWD